MYLCTSLNYIYSCAPAGKVPYVYLNTLTQPHPRFAPPIRLQISPFDKNALVVPPIGAPSSGGSGDGGASREGPSVPATAVNDPAATAVSGITAPGGGPSKPYDYEIEAQLLLPFSAAWALDNKDVVLKTLKTTFKVTDAEELIITGIGSAARSRSRSVFTANSETASPRTPCPS